MPRWVLDSSAVLGMLRHEAGCGVVRELLPEAALSTVNVAECLAWMTRQGLPAAAAWAAMQDLHLMFAPFDEGQAQYSGVLAEQSLGAGLSLGDRACLALAHAFEVPAVTADRAWARLRLGVEVRLIR
ncbi:MAG TPA: type II toxin-antitoxin system VapC family toxin [Terriglobales bacterium]|nr:type II toxin-antitoxin system VapC family toxin [Terriglobales bacterium]